MKFGQQGETKSCMQEYNLGDFSKFYPQNIFKLALNLYFGSKVAPHAIGFRGFFKKTCYYMTNPPCHGIEHICRITGHATYILVRRY